MPPFVTALRPRDLISRAFENKDVFDVRAAFDRRVNNGLGRNCLSTTTSFVCSKDDAALAVIDTVTKSLCRKARKHHRVDSTDARTCEEGNDGLPCHRKVDGHSVAFLDTEGFESIGEAGHFVQQFNKANITARAWFISFVDDRCLRITDQIRCEDMMKLMRQERTLSGCLKAQRSTQLYDAFKAPSGNQTMSPLSKLPARTVLKGLSQCSVSRATF